jgi:ABC-type multidrug transport system ATPase subunit
MEDDTTVVFVSHTHGELKALSDRCLWLEDGVVIQEGEPAAVVNAYEDHHGVHQPDLELDEDKGAFSFVWRPDAPGAGGPVAGSPTSS